MRNQTHFRTAFLVTIMAFAAPSAMAQDPVKVDSKHYKVEVDNSQVQVVRITYGPHEKSVMHEHPAGVVTFLTDAHFRFTYPDGKSEEIRAKVGDAMWFEAFTRLPENLSDMRFEAIYVGLKAGSKPAKPSEIRTPGNKGH